MLSISDLLRSPQLSEKDRAKLQKLEGKKLSPAQEATVARLRKKYAASPKPKPQAEPKPTPTPSPPVTDGLTDPLADWRQFIADFVAIQKATFEEMAETRKPNDLSPLEELLWEMNTSAPTPPTPTPAKTEQAQSPARSTQDNAPLTW